MFLNNFSTDLASIEEECLQNFASMTEEEKILMLKSWTDQISAWIFRARKYIQQNKDLQKKLKINQQQTKRMSEASKSFTWISELFKNRRIAASQLTNNAILTDGYILLNTIGETLRGEEIVYSITVTSTGLEIANSAQGEVFTYRLKLNDFLNIVKFTPSRVTLQAPTAIHKALKEAYNPEEWSQQKIDEFTAFSSQVRSGHFIEYFQKDYGKINNGNLLEAYLRHKKNGYAIQLQAPNNNHDYWSAIFHSVQNTMAAPDAFFLGGDIDDEQIKGLNASVTNLTTLLVHLQDVLRILISTPIGAEQVRKKVKKSAFSNFENNINLTIEQVVSQLLNKFTSNVIRT